MSRRNSIILGLLFVILVVELIILAPKEIGTGADVQQVASGGPPETNEKYRQIMDNVHSVEAKPEGQQWELWADKGMQPRDNADWTIQNVRVKFYAADGVIYTVTGKQGHVAPNEKGLRDIRISGNVVTRSSNGHVFKSQDVLYDSDKKRLKSPDAIEMSSPRDKEGGEMILTGVDMVSELATNEISIAKNVHAKKLLKDNRLLQIQSERAVFSGKSKMAHFFGKVLLTLDNMSVTGPEAKFVYDSQMEELESLDVAGGVKVTDADKFATSQSVNLNLKSNKVVFRGAPRVVQNGDEMTGDLITFLDGGKRVQVSNAKAQFEANSVQGREPAPAEKKQ